MCVWPPSSNNPTKLEQKNPGGGALLGILRGSVPPVLQILTLFQTQKCNFSYPFSDLAFRQKLCFITQIRAQTKKFFTPISNSHISLSYSFGIETKSTFIRSRSSFKTHSRFETKMGKAPDTRFQTKTAPKPYPIGRHIPI